MANVIDIITRSRNEASAGLDRTTRSVQGLNRALLLIPPSSRLAFKQFEGLAAVGLQFGAAGVAVGALALSVVGLARVSQIAVREVADLAKRADELQKKKLISAETAITFREINAEMKELNKQLLAIKIDALAAIAPVVEDALEAFNKMINRLKILPSLFAVVAQAAALMWKSLDPRSVIREGQAMFVPLLTEIHKLVDVAKQIKLQDALGEIGDKAEDAGKKIRDIALFMSQQPFSLGLGLKGRSEFGAFGKPTPADQVPGPRALDPRHQVLGDWHSTIEQITSSAMVLDDTLSALFNGLQSGFTQVFQGLLDKTQTFGNAMKTLFRSLVNEILAQLARIAAARVFGFILNLLRGSGVSGVAVNTAGVTGGATTVTPLAGRPVAPQVHIHAIDERSFAEHFRSLRGAGVVTERRMAEAVDW